MCMGASYETVRNIALAPKPAPAPQPKTFLNPMTGQKVVTAQQPAVKPYQSSLAQTILENNPFNQAARQQQAAVAEANRRQQELDRIATERQALAAQQEAALKNAEAQRAQISAEQQRQAEIARQRQLEQQRQMEAQRQAEAARMAEQQRIQQEEIARQRAEQERVIAAQKLAAGAASTSLRVLGQRPNQAGPTAAMTGAEATPDVQGTKRRKGGTAADSLRIGASQVGQGVGVNLGG